jgi:hypothetical protein
MITSMVIEERADWASPVNVGFIALPCHVITRHHNHRLQNSELIQIPDMSGQDRGVWGGVWLVQCHHR